MKMYFIKLALTSSVLAMLVVNSPLVFAIVGGTPSSDEAANDNASQIVNAIGEVKANTQGVKGAVNQVKQAIVSSKDELKEAINNNNSASGAKAIINYMAETSIRHYEKEMENMLLPAPGSVSAMKTGILIKNYFYGDSAKIFVADAMKRGLSIQQATDYGGKIKLFNMLKDYFIIPEGATQDVNKLNKINITTLMQNDTVSSDDLNSLMDVLTNPFPIPLNLTTLEGAEGELSIVDQEFLAKRAAQQAVLSVALNAFSEIASKRVPSQSTFNGNSTNNILDLPPNAPGVGESMIAALKRESEARFADPQWYAELGRASTESILRELAHMEAFRLWVEYQKYRQDEVMVSLLATMVAMNSQMASGMSAISERLSEASTQVKDISKDLKDMDLEAAQEAAQEAAPE